MTSEPEPVDLVLAALADPMRRRILDGLAVTGTATATALAAGLPVSRQAVVKHLAVLDRAGLVTGLRSGREVHYRLRPSPLDATARWMAGLAAQWDRRLAAIKSLAEAAQAVRAAQAGQETGAQTGQETGAQTGRGAIVQAAPAAGSAADEPDG